MIYAMMARELGLSATYVRNISISAHHRYKVYTIPKRNGGRRIISHPAKELKVLQRWLVDEIFEAIPLHDAALGYRAGVGIGKIVQRHSGSRYFLRMDFADFFESIRARDIQHLLAKNWGGLPISLPKADIDRIVHIVCRGNALTIGAPSSPILSNAVMFEFDSAVQDKCRDLGCTYSRYADDLFFSVNTPRVLEEVETFVLNLTSKLQYPKVEVNRRKTIHSSKKHRVRFLGLILTPAGGVSLGREKKREIKSLVHGFKCGNLELESLIYLRGYLSFALSVEPSFIRSLERKYAEDTIQSIMQAP